jgi:lipopolysaccharide export system permease protein
MKKLDLYIIRKFLGTFVYAIALIILITIIFDISEKIDDFLEKKAPLSEIVFTYYFNFIPYFVNLFSPLFTFIAVVFFTAKMASDTEIVAILSNGVSFRRLMLPYFISSAVLALFSFYLTNFVIPHSNQKRIAFENRYIRNAFYNRETNIHFQVKPGVFVYFESYNNIDNVGYKFALEKFKDNKLRYKLMSDVMRWDTIKKNWVIENYFVREIDGMKEKITKGIRKDTVLSFGPEEFVRRNKDVETMNWSELNNFIAEEQLKGSDEVPFYLIEKYHRISNPFATFILTLIGVSLASRKVRGGIGLHIGLGLLISFSFILFLQISTTFATSGNLSPLLAVWLPNIVYLILGLYLLRAAPK